MLLDRLVYRFFTTGIIGLLCTVQWSLAQPNELDYSYQQNKIKISSKTNILDFTSAQKAKLVPYGILQLAGRYKNIFWYAFEQGKLIILRREKGIYKPVYSYAISIGKNGYNKLIEGDKRTPIGVYFYQDFIQDKNLDDYYGLGAYPIDYPNSFDKFRGRTGYGIWLHGYPKGVPTRPLRDSRGCMVVSNSHFQELMPIIDSGNSIVILQDYFQWSDPKKSRVLYNQINRSILKWRKAWNNGSLSKHMRWYAKDFTTLKGSVSEYKKTRRGQLSQEKRPTWVLAKKSVILYPGTDDTVFVEFTKKAIDGSDHTMQQYWQLQGRSWRILYEGLKK